MHVSPAGQYRIQTIGIGNIDSDENLIGCGVSVGNNQIVFVPYAEEYTDTTAPYDSIYTEFLISYAIVF